MKHCMVFLAGSKYNVLLKACFPPFTAKLLYQQQTHMTALQPTLPQKHAYFI